MPPPVIEVHPAREEAELRAYLGADFRLELLQDYEGTLAREAERIGDEARLYRTSEAYLYNLTAFAMTATKVPYVNELVKHLPAGARLLDYGCGIGSDGLALAEAGYRVEFADFDNPSAAYLRWRLQRRGIEARVHDLDRGVPGSFDAAYAFDVIEHVADPFAFLTEMEERAKLVVVNLLEPDQTELHHDLPIEAILEHARDRGIRSHRLLHGRSHLLVYSSGASLPRVAKIEPSLRSANRAGAPDRLRRQVEALDWYHTIELPGGVVTPGWFDLRPVADEMPIPNDLRGKRCLDVGTFDGFWAFEMEARNGDVVAIDILDPAGWDWPAGSDEATVEAIDRRKRGGDGFELVASELGSNVERRQLSVYDLDPESCGSFDLVYLGSLLLHLRDPVRALAAVRRVCAGQLIVCDAVDLGKSALFPREPVASLDGRGRPWWWRPNIAGLERMVEAAGFRRVGSTKRLRLPAGPGMGSVPISAGTLRSRSARRHLLHSRLGEPHAVVVGDPA